MADIESRIFEIAGEGIVFIFEFPASHETGKTFKHLRLERKSLADFASRRPSAISNHIGSHGRAQFSVTFIDILNGALTLVAAGQVEIDIGPFSTFFRKKTLEEQIHTDRVNGCNTQGIADCAIGGG